MLAVCVRVCVSAHECQCLGTFFLVSDLQPQNLHANLYSFSCAADYYLTII